MRKTGALEQTLAIAMETATDSLIGPPDLSDDVLKQITASMEGEPVEISQDGTDKDLDARIASALKDVKAQMRKET